MILVVEQFLNGLQYGVMLFLLAAGLTLIFGIMGVINLAHGSLYMIGAFAGTWVAIQTGQLLAGPAGGAGGRALAGAGDGVRRGAPALCARPSRPGAGDVRADPDLQRERGADLRPPAAVHRLPEVFSAPSQICRGCPTQPIGCSSSRSGLPWRLGLYLLINRTRIGMLVRAGATNRKMVRALGVDIRRLYTLVFGLGALLAGLAGYMAGPILSVQVGMGEQILLATFVVVVIGGVGSIRGAFVAALVLGMMDTMLRAFLPGMLAGSCRPVRRRCWGRASRRWGFI